MDLNTIDNSPAEKGVSLIIKDTDIEITVVSMNSNRAQKIFLANKEENTDVTPLLTIGWKNITRNGKEIEFSVEEARKLYAEYPLIGNQVAEFILNEQNFLKKN